MLTAYYLGDFLTMVSNTDHFKALVHRSEDPFGLAKDLMRSIYMLTFTAVLKLKFARRKVHRFTRWAIFFILLYRMVPTLIWFGYPSDYLMPESMQNTFLNPANLKANYTAHRSQQKELEAAA